MKLPSADAESRVEPCRQSPVARERLGQARRDGDRSARDLRTDAELALRQEELRGEVRSSG
jgi:hypothetical protein